jgi:hypothetical protein
LGESIGASSGVGGDHDGIRMYADMLYLCPVADDKWELVEMDDGDTIVFDSLEEAVSEAERRLAAKKARH